MPQLLSGFVHVAISVVPSLLPNGFAQQCCSDLMLMREISHSIACLLKDVRLAAVLLELLL
jgi:hypothetical protein